MWQAWGKGLGGSIGNAGGVGGYEWMEEVLAIAAG